MGDRPILFSAPMVRALLAGTKTQTRRVIKLPDWADRIVYDAFHGWRFDSDQHFEPLSLRIAVGDRLYVREHWRTSGSVDTTAPRDLPRSAAVLYEADGHFPVWAGRFRQSMHMPRWASRLTLHVTDVRMQRLQDISEEDARAEGIQPRPSGMYGPPPDDDADDVVVADNPTEAYMELWNSINGAGSWGVNPWVAAYTFTVEHANIDSARQAA